MCAPAGYGSHAALQPCRGGNLPPADRCDTTLGRHAGRPLRHIPCVMLSASEASVSPVLLRDGKTPSVSFADSSLKEGASPPLSGGRFFWGGCTTFVRGATTRARAIFSRHSERSEESVSLVFSEKPGTGNTDSSACGLRMTGVRCAPPPRPPPPAPLRGAPPASAPPYLLFFTGSGAPARSSARRYPPG